MCVWNPISRKFKNQTSFEVCEFAAHFLNVDNLQTQTTKEGFCPAIFSVFFQIARRQFHRKALLKAAQKTTTASGGTAKKSFSAPNPAKTWLAITFVGSELALENIGSASKRDALSQNASFSKFIAICNKSRFSSVCSKTF